jgi:glycosyltransferase involved in cell wall biosynthesis
MKISFLTLAGTENSTTRRVVFIARELKRRGHEIDFHSLNWVARKGSANRENSIFEGITVKGIKIGNSIFSMLVSGPLKMMFKLRGNIIILSKPLPPHTIPFLISRIFSRKKFILDADDWEGTGGGASFSHFSTFKRTLITFLEEYTARKAAGVTAASRVLERKMSDAGAKNVLYLPNVADAADFNIPEKEKESLEKELGIKGEMVFISASSLESDILTEGTKLFLEGFAKAKGKYKLIITGQGKHKEAIKEMCKKFGIFNNVIFTGLMPLSEFNVYVAISDCAIVPLISRYPYTLYSMSSSPRKMYEAMAAGLPVIGFNGGELKETLGATNFTVEEEPEAITAKLEEIMSTGRKKLKGIGKDNQQLIKAKYNFKLQGEMLAKFIKSI